MKLPVFAILATVISGCTAVPAAAATNPTTPTIQEIQDNMTKGMRNCFIIGQLAEAFDYDTDTIETARKACFLKPTDKIPLISEPQK